MTAHCGSAFLSMESNRYARARLEALSLQWHHIYAAVDRCTEVWSPQVAKGGYLYEREKFDVSNAKRRLTVDH